MTKEIAAAFGLPSESLERVVHDDLLDPSEPCQSCAEWAKKYAELEAVLSVRNESNRNPSPGQHPQFDYQDFCL